MTYDKAFWNKKAKANKLFDDAINQQHQNTVNLTFNKNQEHTVNLILFEHVFHPVEKVLLSPFGLGCLKIWLLGKFFQGPFFFGR